MEGMTNDETARPYPRHLHNHVLAALDIAKTHLQLTGQPEQTERETVAAKINEYLAQYSPEGIIAGYESLTITLLRTIAGQVGPGVDPVKVLDVAEQHIRSLPVTDD